MVFALGFGASLLGDACHVASGTTHYEWDGVPCIWRSAVWFPFLVGGAVLATALLGRRMGCPGARRTRGEAAAGVGVVVAFYALTAALRHQPTTVSVVLCSGIAVAVWALWDPSAGSFVVAAQFAVLGPVAEMLIVAAGASSYGDGVDGLAGVAPWLPCLYFAAGAVASGLWAPVSGSDGR